VAESVKRFSTGEFAVMNCASASHDPNSQTTLIAVGHNEKCQVYSCQLARELVTDESDQPQNNDQLRQRQTASNGGITRQRQTASNGGGQTRFTFQISPLKSVQTDFK
jgi:hypothetical protein